MEKNKILAKWREVDPRSDLAPGLVAAWVDQAYDAYDIPLADLADTAIGWIDENPGWTLEKYAYHVAQDHCLQEL